MPLLFAGGCQADTDTDTATGFEPYEYAGDSECDDRSYIGAGMASVLDRDDTGRDSEDCRRLLQAGMIEQVSKENGIAATQCEAIDFGEDTSEWAHDGECDDPRFDGPGTSSVISLEDLMIDASDCRKQCENQTIWLRKAQ